VEMERVADWQYWTNGWWCPNMRDAENKAEGRHNIWQVPVGENDPSKGKLIVRWRTIR
jgi:hypothetical protein